MGGEKETEREWWLVVTVTRRVLGWSLFHPASLPALNLCPGCVPAPSSAKSLNLLFISPGCIGFSPTWEFENVPQES